MSTSDIAIWRSANLLVDRHDDTAAIHAAMRADTMLDQGDLDGYVVWRRVVRAVRELMSREPVRLASPATHQPPAGERETRAGQDIACDLPRVWAPVRGSGPRGHSLCQSDRMAIAS